MPLKTLVSFLVAVGLAPAAMLASTPAFASQTSRVGALTRVQPCFGKSAIKPTSYVIACADANAELKSMHWKTWTSTRATGTGVFWQNDCTPYCAAGKFHSYKATVTLSLPKSTKLGPIFSQLTVIYQVGSKTKRLSDSLPLKAFG